MPTAESKSRLLALAALLTPVLLVKGVAAYLGVSGPARVSAADVVDEEKPAFVTPWSPPDWTDESTAARAYASSISQHGFPGSPFLYDDLMTESDEPDLPAGPDDGTESLPEVDLQMVIGGRRPMVQIGGRPYSLGDTVIEGWVVTAIDSDGRSVTLTETTSGRTVTSTMESD